MEKQTIHFFFKTGGEQPTVIDAAAINKFFTGNYAKVWAMTEGFFAEFISYENGVIRFKMITDPRNRVHHFILSKFIAVEFKSKVQVLAGARSYIADHYKAEDIIGFNLAGDEMDKLDEYRSRVNKAHDGLPAEPHLKHFGSIP